MTTRTRLARRVIASTRARSARRYHWSKGHKDCEKIVTEVTEQEPSPAHVGQAAADFSPAFHLRSIQDIIAKYRPSLVEGLEAQHPFRATQAGLKGDIEVCAKTFAVHLRESPPSGPLVMHGNETSATCCEESIDA